MLCDAYIIAPHFASGAGCLRRGVSCSVVFRILQQKFAKYYTTTIAGACICRESREQQYSSRVFHDMGREFESKMQPFCDFGGKDQGMLYCSSRFNLSNVRCHLDDARSIRWFICAQIGHMLNIRVNCEVMFQLVSQMI